MSVKIRLEWVAIPVVPGGRTIWVDMVLLPFFSRCVFFFFKLKVYRSLGCPTRCRGGRLSMHGVGEGVGVEL